MMNDILILGYSVLDEGYEQGKVMAVSGKDGTSDWDPGDINDPVNTGYQLEPTAEDPLLNPLVLGGNLRILLAKIVSNPPAQPSNPTTYTVLEPSNADMHDWSSPKAENVTLTYQGAVVATNPHGLAQVGDVAYIGSYDSHKIFLLEPGELDGLSNISHPLERAPFDVEAALPVGTLNANAKGQSIIALENSDGDVFLFVLFIVYNAPLKVWNHSIIVRLAVDVASGNLSYDTHTTVGKNAQEMWPIFKGEEDEDVLLLVSAIGGEQKSETTNGTQSNVCALPAFGTWPAPPATPGPEPAAVRLFTGDPLESLYPRTYADPKRAKDMRVAAASTRPSPDALVFFMAAGFTDDYRGADYRIYRTTVQDLFDLYNPPEPPNTSDPEESAGETVPKDDPSPTLSSPPAVSELVEDEIFEVVREGQVYSSSIKEIPYGVFYLGLLYENAEDVEGERVLQFLGSALTIDSAKHFGGRSLTFGLGNGPGQIGGKNVNSAVQLAETIRQVEKGHSLKRGVKAVRAPLVTVSGEEEEREDE
jgi:hypothetical protein